MSQRDQPVQLSPAGLSGFPTRPVTGRWFREHQFRTDDDGGCWFFSPVTTGGGRWDLSAPSGSCYLASSAAVAARERVGPLSAQHMPVPEDLVDGRLVSTVDLSDLNLRPADLLADAAVDQFGVTGELSKTADYELTQQWAHALHRRGHASLIYTPRFSPRGQALALFGPSGTNPIAPVVDRRPLRSVLEELGIPVHRIPGSSSLTIIE